MFAGKNYYYTDCGDCTTVYATTLRGWFDFASVRFTQAEIAQSAGISRTTLWRYRSGKRVSDQTAYFLALGLKSLFMDYPETRFGLTDHFGILMETQTTLF